LFVPLQHHHHDVSKAGQDAVLLSLEINKQGKSRESHINAPPRPLHGDEHPGPQNSTVFRDIWLSTRQLWVHLALSEWKKY
jgi:hypothetical protein